MDIDEKVERTELEIQTFLWCALRSDLLTKSKVDELEKFLKEHIEMRRNTLKTVEQIYDKAKSRQ